MCIAVAGVATPSGAQDTPAPQEPPPAASAAPAPRPIAAALDVVPGATCFEEGVLETEVQSWLGRDRLGPDVEVHVTGDAQDPHVVAFRIVRGGKTRERRFDHLPSGCEEATAVVALAIALAIDANAVPGWAAPPVDADGEGARPVRMFAAQVAGGYEVLPAASVGLVAGIEYGLASWFGLRLDLLTQGSWSNAIDGVSGVFDTFVGAAVPQVCAGGPVSADARLDLCSGAAVGFIHVQGRGYAVSQSATGSWIVATGGVRLLFDAGIPWALDLDGVFPVHTPAVRAEDAVGRDQPRAPNPAGALLSVGPAFTF
jgi:hypothetical protein